MKIKLSFLKKVGILARVLILVLGIVLLMPEKPGYRPDTGISASESKRSALGVVSQDSFGIEEIRPGRIFTPNGDGWNDYLEIKYSNPTDSIVSGRIYSWAGRLVSYMGKDISQETLRWDGKNMDGNTADSGIYIYQIEVTGGENLTINGVIILAR